MNCKVCGFVNDSQDSICRNCGSPLENKTADDIFGEDILKPIEITNLNDNNLNNSSSEEINELENKVDDKINAQLMPNDNAPINPVPLPFSSEAIGDIQPSLNNNLESSTIKENSQDKISDNQNIIPKEPFDMKKTLVIVSGIVLASLIILLAVIILTKSQTNKYQGEIKEETNQNYKISFNGYDITIPNTLAYEVNEDSLIIKEKNEEWITIIQVSNFNYSKLVVNKDKIKTSYESLGMKVSTMIEKTYNDVTYLTSEMKKADTEMVLGITKASAEQSFVVISIKPNYTLSYDGLNNISTILKNATYTGTNTTTSIKSDFFDFSQIKE